MIENHQIIETKRKYRDNLHRYPNVIGSGIGYKVKGGKKTDEVSIQIFVSKKINIKKLNKDHIIPSTVEGYSTDVVEMEMPYALAVNHTGRYRPAFPGISIGHYAITAGTLGCVYSKSGTKFILSNNHVLANSNTGIIGDPILQPGPYDGGTIANDKIGTLHSFVPVLFGNDSTNPNYIDAALCLPTNQADVDPVVQDLGTPTGVITTPTLGMSVAYSGRSSGIKRATIASISLDVQVSYEPHGTAYFEDQLMLSLDAIRGDSGSTVFSDPTMDYVGLVFAGGEGGAICNKFGEVYARLIIGTFSQGTIDGNIGGLTTKWVSGSRIGLPDLYRSGRPVFSNYSSLWAPNQIDRSSDGKIYVSDTSALVSYAWSSSDSGTSWTEHLLPSIPNMQQGYIGLLISPSLASDNSASIHIAGYGGAPNSNDRGGLTDNQGIYYLNGNNSSWSTPDKIKGGEWAGNTYKYYVLPTLAVDSNDTLHLVYQWLFGYSLFYQNKTKNGSWSTVESIGQNNGIAFDEGSALAVDSSNTLHMFSASKFYGSWWGQDAIDGNNGVFYISRSSSGIWSSMTAIYNTHSSDTYAIGPCSIIDSSGNIHLVFSVFNTNVGTYSGIYLKKPYGGSWITMPNFESTYFPYKPALSIDLTGKLHIVYPRNGPSGYEAVYKTYSGGAWSIETLHLAGINHCGVVSSLSQSKNSAIASTGVLYYCGASFSSVLYNMEQIPEATIFKSFDFALPYVPTAYTSSLSAKIGTKASAPSYQLTIKARKESMSIVRLGQKSSSKTFAKINRILNSANGLKSSFKYIIHTSKVAVSSSIGVYASGLQVKKNFKIKLLSSKVGLILPKIVGGVFRTLGIKFGISSKIHTSRTYEFVKSFLGLFARRGGNNTWSFIELSKIGISSVLSIKRQIIILISKIGLHINKIPYAAFEVILNSIGFVSTILHRFTFLRIILGKLGVTGRLRKISNFARMLVVAIGDYVQRYIDYTKNGIAYYSRLLATSLLLRPKLYRVFLSRKLIQAAVALCSTVYKGAVRILYSYLYLVSIVFSGFYKVFNTAIRYTILALNRNFIFARLLTSIFGIASKLSRINYGKFVSVIKLLPKVSYVASWILRINFRFLFSYIGISSHKTIKRIKDKTLRVLKFLKRV